MICFETGGLLVFEANDFGDGTSNYVNTMTLIAIGCA